MSTTLDQLYILHFDGGSQVGPMTRAMRNETRFLLGAYLERGEA